MENMEQRIKSKWKGSNRECDKGKWSNVEQSKGKVQ